MSSGNKRRWWRESDGVACYLDQGPCFQLDACEARCSLCEQGVMLHRQQKSDLFFLWYFVLDGKIKLIIDTTWYNLSIIKAIVF